MRSLHPLAVLFAIALVWLSAKPSTAQVDVNKLKPGDKLEMDDFGNWVTVEFVEKISDQMVRVKKPDFPLPVGALVRRLRPAKASRATTTGPQDNPFATPEEKIAKKAQQRSWSDPSGKFRVDATLLSVADESVVLRRHDDKEITVPLTKLCDEDQKYVRELMATITSTDAGNAAVAPAIPVKFTDVTSAPQLTIASDAKWTFSPEEAAAAEILKPAQIALRQVGFFAGASRMLFAPKEKKVFVVFKDSPPGNSKSVFGVQACDLARRTVSSAGTFGVEVSPLAVAPGGAWVVARTEKFGFGGQAELQLYARQGNKVDPLAAWFPYRHHPSPFAGWDSSKERNPGRPELSREADVVWADFLDDQHVMTSSGNGEVAVWRVPELEPAYYVAPIYSVGANNLHPALCASNAYFSLPTNDGVALLRSKDGTQAGFLPADMAGVHIYRMAWSDDGTRLALLQPGRVRVWNLEDQELIRDFPVAVSARMADSGWIGNTHLVADGRILIDVERRIPLAVVATHGPGVTQIRNGVLWQLVSGGLQPASLVGKDAMPKTFQDPAAGASADELLVIKPGMEVTVDLPAGVRPDGSDPHAAVIRQLEKNGMKVVPDSPIRLVGTISTGETQSVRYRTHGLRGGVTNTSVTEQILTLRFAIDGETVWQYESRMGAPGIVRMNAGESIDQALSRVRRLDGTSFDHVWIPAWVAKVPTDVQLSLEGKSG